MELSPSEVFVGRVGLNGENTGFLVMLERSDGERQYEEDNKPVVHEEYVDARLRRAKCNTSTSSSDRTFHMLLGMPISRPSLVSC
jgi:hypothetical protein